MKHHYLAPMVEKTILSPLNCPFHLKIWRKQMTICVWIYFHSSPLISSFIVMDCSVLIALALQYALKSNSISHPTLFLSKVFFNCLNILYFLINYIISLVISTKKKSTGTALNLWSNFRITDILNYYCTSTTIPIDKAIESPDPWTWYISPFV